MIHILGGNGFVGSGLVRGCRGRGLEHQALDRANYAALAGRRCDVFINANGNSWKPLARQRPLDDFDANVRNVRRSLLDFPADLYVHLSSCDVYPDCSSPEVTREDAVPDVSRQSPYGFHKFLGEQCVRHQARRWLVLRLGGMVGPGLRKNAVFDVLHGGPLWLDPRSRLQFMHVDDVAQIVLSLIQRGIENEVLNVCGRGLIEISEVVRAAGCEVPVQPGSPTVCYDVSIEKLAGLVDVPETRPAVLSFVAHGESRGRLAA